MTISDLSLPYPVTFVVRYPERWPELFQPYKTLLPDPNSLHSRIQTNEECWIILTYLYLKRKHLTVSISDRFIPGQICVVSSLDLKISDRNFNSFVVGCRSDGFQPPLCDITVVQNKLCLDSETDIFIPHWPQPGLIPRLKERGSTIENIVFKGDEINLYESFRSPEFKRELEKLGVTLRINGQLENQPVRWHDYSTDDLVLAVRDVTEKDALVKPASKLVNAWIAGVPALLGPEPAFREQRKSELDYIEVTTPQAVFEAVQLLKSHPELYQQMVASGNKRAEDFTEEKMIQRWYEFLAGPVADGYKRWQQRSQVSRMAEFALRSVQHKISVRKALYDRLHGYRPISGTHT
ncbi:hypothetical protein NDI43_02155 [Microcoleus vaginatus GB2-A3]|uniref:glycosyltransferase n=1 Tax=Microcoleus vaginatus TaxID=119532 RepID=UPI0032A1EC0D